MYYDKRVRVTGKYHNALIMQEGSNRKNIHEIFDEKRIVRIE